MARRPSIGETLLGGVIIALVAFVAAQVLASPSRASDKPERTLTARDSAAIAAQYRSQLWARRGAYDVPEWLASVQIERLQAAAERDVAGRDALPPMSVDTMRSMIAAAMDGTYLRAMLAEDDNIITRWRERA